MLTFEQLRWVNVMRMTRWHGPDAAPWSGADWGNAMGGEAGEAQNFIKKLRRIETGIWPDGPKAELIEGLRLELADVVTYCDLIAHHYGIDLEQAVIDKFNMVSERHGFPERLVDETDRIAYEEQERRDAEEFGA